MQYELNDDSTNWGDFHGEDLDEFEPNRLRMRNAACAIMCLLTLGIVAVVVAAVLS
jgi:hypothetical protein